MLYFLKENTIHLDPIYAKEKFHVFYDKIVVEQKEFHLYHQKNQK